MNASLRIACVRPVTNECDLDFEAGRPGGPKPVCANGRFLALGLKASFSTISYTLNPGTTASRPQTAEPQDATATLDPLSESLVVRTCPGSVEATASSALRLQY